MLSCPNCGGNLKFDIPSQQLSCDHCRTLFNPYDFDSKTEDAGETTSFDGQFEVTVFTCPQCGGEILSTDNAASGFCSFCGASTILYSRISKEQRPDYIIPFKLTKEQCKQKYAERMKHAPFAPKALKDPAAIDSFRGIYMPYWAFYISQRGPVSLNGKKSHRSGDYIITDHYALSGKLDAYYKGISYDASSSFSDNISEAIAPYDLKGMKAFTPGYLSGFYADTADVDATIYEPDAQSAAVSETNEQLQHMSVFSPYTMDTLTPAQLNTKTEAVDRAMLPVWFMSYRKNNRVAYATVNGQTGKVVADIPIDPLRYVIGSLLLAIPLFALLAFFSVLLPKTLVGISLVLSFLAAGIHITECLKIQKKDSGAEDRGKAFARHQNQAPTLVIPPTEKASPAGWILSLCAAAISILVLIADPVWDIFYYACALCSLGAILIAFISIIRAYNLLSTRRLPQFDKKGGDDRA